VSFHEPVFRQIETYRPGSHRGMYFNMGQRSNRRKQATRVPESLGIESIAAGRLAFATWLVEMRVLLDDPTKEQVPVAQARPHGLEAWWTLDDGELEVRTDHRVPPRLAAVTVSWAPLLVLGLAKGAAQHVIEDAYDRVVRLYAPDELMTDRQKARAWQRVAAIRAAFAVLSWSGSRR
jgi:hypothetical protein